MVHDEQGWARAGCGVIGARFSRHQLSFSILGNYPGSVLTVRGVAATVGGTLIMEYLHDSEMVAVRGVITGLNASTTGGGTSMLVFRARQRRSLADTIIWTTSRTPGWVSHTRLIPTASQR